MRTEVSFLEKMRRCGTGKMPEIVNKVRLVVIAVCQRTVQIVTLPGQQQMAGQLFKADNAPEMAWRHTEVLTKYLLKIAGAEP